MEKRFRFEPKRWMVAVGIIAVLATAVAAIVLWTPGKSHRRERGPRVTEETTSVEATPSDESTPTSATVEPTMVPQPKPKATSWTSSSLVVFVREKALWAVREDGRGTSRRVAGLTDASTYLTSPDHTLVAYTKPRGSKKPLYVTNLQSEATRKVADNTDAFQGLAFCFSPTGDRIAYTVPVYSGSLRTGERLNTMKSDGSAKRLLATSAGSPAWGPNDNIVFRRVDFAHGAWQLWTTRATGGSLKRVPSSSQATSYDWTTKRADLAFAVTEPVARGGLSAVWVLKEGETSPQPVLQEKLSQATYTRLVWSPDGTQIAVDAAGDDGYSRVTVIQAADLNISWQVNSRRDNYFSCWSEDGTRLLYFEGNVFQGAPSNLWNIKDNGLSRRIVVTDAAVE